MTENISFKQLVEESNVSGISRLIMYADPDKTNWRVCIIHNGEVTEIALENKYLDLYINHLTSLKDQLDMGTEYDSFLRSSQPPPKITYRGPTGDLPPDGSGVTGLTGPVGPVPQ